MKATFLITVIVCLVTSALPVAAQEKTPAPTDVFWSESESVARGPVAAAIAREAVLLAQSTLPTVTPGSQAGQQPGQHRRFISRHPVAFYTLVGAGIGLVAGVVAYGSCKPEPGVTACSTGGVGIVLFPFLGGGAGALVGLVVKAVR